MQFKDYYEIIGVQRDANQQEIKRAYKKLARKYHPDVSKETDAELKFKELGEAYEVLKDPEKRIAYDQFGANYKSGQDFNPPPNWDEGFEFNGASHSASFSDFFESLFGQQFNSAYEGANRQQAHGEDHHAKIFIDIDDAFNGATRSISLQAPTVNSQGQVVTSTRTLNVNIPKGVKQGQLIRLAGQGTAGLSNGKPGDLYLEVNFKTHDFYRVEGKDIYLDLPVAPWEAVLGTTVKTPTPDGKVNLKIPAGAVSGHKMRLKGRGIPAKIPGDLYVIINLVLPPADNQKAEDFYRKMEKELNFEPRAALKV
ncbi:MAG: cytochrome C biogenesis protein [endosymbiont of Galathealinum brachiosum]|uniref:Cytochrome C biogenesis protein n=1 Tax=endosymbiont of Galathealinum brachiosum TaxID=2200906 RepID=A0A370DIT9_9GAMM|nr:MAG: cytochrome C biogenesis protein [endosymbiont of Galathealinum brachiosum]